MPSGDWCFWRRWRRANPRWSSRSRPTPGLELNQARSALTTLEAHLEQLSPLKILDRGYAIVEHDGKLVKSPEDAPAGSDVRVRFARGEIAAKVTGGAGVPA
jgi:exonuclease VII large subunit